jgi:ankyrin repeat protein
VRRTGGRTPLHSAAAFGRLECAKELLTLGADPEARAEDGSLPADLITTSCSMSAWPTTHGEELRELLRAAVEEKRKAAA